MLLLIYVLSEGYMTNTSNQKIRVLSGIRASHSSLHLGNLLGAISGMLVLQNNPKYETYYMVADLHGITTPYEVEELRKNRINVAIEYLAAGIDPNKSTLFLQSNVSEHTELAYYLSVAISPDKLRHLPAYKDKVEQFRGFPENMALLSYPVLMAADILLYKASEVPIGPDQYAHLEIARDIARKMNSVYGTDFPEPHPYSVNDEKMMVPSVLGKGKKMSKSNPESAIFLNDSYEQILKKIMKLPTDSGRGSVIPTKDKHHEDDLYPLFSLVELVLGPERKLRLIEEYLGDGVNYKEIKIELAEGIFKKIEPIQIKRKELENNLEYVEKVLRDGAEKAKIVAKKTVAEVRQKMGLA